MSRRPSPPDAEAEGRRAGLCARCRHALVIATRRGSRFYLCRLSRADARYPRYPRLPVLECSGHEPRDATKRPPGLPGPESS